MEKLRIGIVGSVGHAEKFARLINGYPESQVVVYCAQGDAAAEIAGKLGVPLEKDFHIRMWEAIPIPLCGAVRLPDRRGICSALFRTPDTFLPEFVGAQIPLPFLPGLRQSP